MPKPLNLAGQTFGFLTVLEKAPNSGKKTRWLCRCSLCGSEKMIQTCHLTSGASQSCGCRRNTNPPSTRTITEIEKVCPICNNTFIANNGQRKYCYNCSPTGLPAADRLRLLDRKLKHRLVSYKGGKCEKCGYDKCEGALQFHHINPNEKEFTIANINFGEQFNMDTLLAEVDKCMLLCANCHAEIHYKEN